MIEIPTLTTPRLILRGPRPDDTEALMAALADDEFARFITREGRGLDRAEAWRVAAIVAGGWFARGYSEFIVEERASGEVVGRVGPWHPEGWPDFEIGWAIFPEHQGKGYAVESAAAAMIWSHDALGRDQVVHLIDPRNVASERVAAALGAEPTGDWIVPSGADCRIWTTRWERFIATPAYRQVAAAAARP